MYTGWPGPLLSAPQKGTKFVVGFLHMGAKEVFERASTYAQDLQSHHYLQTQSMVVYEGTP